MDQPTKGAVRRSFVQKTRRHFPIARRVSCLPPS